MTLQQIESQCRSKAEELIKKYFGNINHEAAIEQPETIGDYSLELPRQIEAEYRGAAAGFAVRFYGRCEKARTSHTILPYYH